MEIPAGANTAVAMKFINSEIGEEWMVDKNYDDIYSLLGAFMATLDVYEIPQPAPIVKGIEFMIKEFNL